MDLVRHRYLRRIPGGPWSCATLAPDEEAELRVAYDERQTLRRGLLDRWLRPFKSLSPSAWKPALTVDAWRAAGITLEEVPVERLSVEQIALAHEPAYVRDVLAGARPNGFGNTLPSVAETLPWTTGSMATAALVAARDGGAVASPTSGFHHAGYDEGGGFCTFNGLVIAARLVRAAVPDRDVGILDLDMHYGNGTDDILRRLDLGWVRHWTFGEHDITPTSAEGWLARLPAIVEGFAGCSVLLYQAGADPHIDDPLGGALTSGQFARRDALVFDGCRALGLPVAWNLAGGYQEPISRVIELHVATARACVRAFP